MESLKNIGLGIVGFLVAFGAFKLAGLTLDAGMWLIILLLILIYFEICY